MGQFARRIAATRAPLSRDTTTPISNSPVRRFRSKGLPSRYRPPVLDVDTVVGAIHSDTMRDPAIHNHTTGSQRALEVCASLSRFKKKRVRIQMANAKVARVGD